jgi:hypothetical protein
MGGDIGAGLSSYKNNEFYLPGLRGALSGVNTGEKIKVLRF